MATVSAARSGAPCGSGVCQRISPVPGSRAAHDPPVIDFARGQRVGLSGVVADGRVDAAAVHRRAPLNPPGVRARADQAGPEQPSRGRVERPIDAGLLANAHDSTPAVADAGREDVGAGTGEVPHAELVGRRTPRDFGRQVPAGKPARVGASAPERPARLPRAEVEGHDELKHAPGGKQLSSHPSGSVAQTRGHRCPAARRGCPPRRRRDRCRGRSPEDSRTRRRHSRPAVRRCRAARTICQRIRRSVHRARAMLPRNVQQTYPGIRPRQARLVRRHVGVEAVAFEDRRGRDDRARIRNRAL